MTFDEIRALLPSVVRRTLEPGTPGYAIVSLMEALQAPSEQVLREIDQYFDPRRTPDAFVPYLAAWLDLSRFFVMEAARERESMPIPIPLDRLREWIARSAELARWRGTPRGLRLLLEIASGTTGFDLDEGEASGRPFHLRVTAPAEAAPYRPLLDRIVALEKPAYMTADPVAFKTAGT